MVKILNRLLIAGFLVISGCISQDSTDAIVGAPMSRGTASVTVAAIPQPTLTLNPNPFNFGNIASGSSYQQNIMLSNNTTVSATIGTITISGAGYSVVGTNCNAIVLSAAANCSIAIRFSPMALGAVSGSLSVPFTSAQGTAYTVTDTLGGTGVAPSTSFAFSGFSGNPGVDTSGLSATGVTVQWTPQSAAAYYKLTEVDGSTTTVSANLFPTSIASHTYNGLLPGHTYSFKINAFDGSDVSDGNNNFVSVTTPNVTGSTFNGWSDLVALGPAFTDVGYLDNALANTGANRLIENLSITPTTTLNSVGGNTNVTRSSWATVKLAWDPFTITPSGVPQSHNIYRSTSALGPWNPSTLIGNNGSSTPTYVDSSATLVSGSTFYYRVIPVYAGVEVPYTIGSDTVISAIIPPTNMTLVHRWMANREVCTNLLGFVYPSSINRDDNYSCNYTWGMTNLGTPAFAPNVPNASKAKWDLGYSFVVDRYLESCKTTATGPIKGAGNPSTGSNGDVYSDGVYCQKNVSGTWVNSATLGSMTNIQRAALFTNNPGYQGAALDQTSSFGVCQNKSATGISAMRLPRLHEMIAMRAMTGVFRNPNNSTMAKILSGTLPETYGSCNYNLSSIAGGPGGSNPMLVPGSNADQGAQVIQGSALTQNCNSRYEVQDVYGNWAYWTEDQAVVGSTNNTFQMIASTLDPASNLIENYLYDGVMGPGESVGSNFFIDTYGDQYQVNTSTGSVPMLGMRSVQTSSVFLGARVTTNSVNEIQGTGFRFSDVGGLFSESNASCGGLFGATAISSQLNNTGLQNRTGWAATANTNTINNRHCFSNGHINPIGFRCAAQIGP